MAYNTQHSKTVQTKDLDTPIMGNQRRMEDGTHNVTIRDIAKTATASGIDTVTLELVNNLGDNHSATIFLYRKDTNEFSNIFKKLLASVFHDSIDTVKEIIQCIQLEDWLVLDYFIEAEIQIVLKSSAGYKIRSGTNGYTFDEKNYYDTIRELRSAATKKNLTPSYTNVIDINKVGELDERTDNTNNTIQDTETKTPSPTKTNHTDFVGSTNTRPIPRKKFF